MTMMKFESASRLLRLPYELREKILQCCYRDVEVIYIRLKIRPKSTAASLEGAAWSARKLLNHLDWRNPCPQLLRVNKQICSEALDALLHKCVLDLWGAVSVGQVKQLMPRISHNVRNVAVSNDRLVDFLELMPDLTALENVFIDSVPTSASYFLNYYTSFMDKDSTRIYDYKLDLIVNQVLSRCPNQVEARPVKVYVRCVTYNEEVVFCCTDKRKLPEMVAEPVQKFDYKFTLDKRIVPKHTSRSNHEEAVDEPPQYLKAVSVIQTGRK